MTDTREYVNAIVPAMGNPCHLMIRLAAAVGSDDYVIYEKPPVWSFAAGSVAELIVTPTRSLLRDDRGDFAVSRNGRTLAEIPGLLDRIRLSDWRAYGIAMFDMSYDNGDTFHHDSDTALVRLIIPRVEVRVADGRATVRGIARAEVQALAEVVGAATPVPHHRSTPVDVEHESSTSFRNMVADVLRDIRDRGIQKVVLSRAVPIDADVDLPATFLLGRGHNTPARSFMVRLDGLCAAGFSPEIIADVSAAGQVLTQPLAGTRALAPDQGDHPDAGLLEDPKEVFEHAIAVRNSCQDIAAVCRPESVAVTDFMVIQRRGTVQHIGSMVRGSLAPGRGPWDAFIALFPTLIGRPRPDAYALIRKYETTPRGLYGGAVLACDAAGNLDATLVIRALFQQDGRTWLRAGVGLVPQSTPDREFEETCEKLRSVSSHVVMRTTVGTS